MRGEAVQAKGTATAKAEDGNELGALRNGREASEAGAERVGDG